MKRRRGNNSDQPQQGTQGPPQPRRILSVPTRVDQMQGTASFPQPVLQPGQSLTGSQLEFPLGSQTEDDAPAEIKVSARDMQLVQEAVKNFAAVFEPTLQTIVASVGPSYSDDVLMDEASVNTALGRTPGFEAVPISVLDNPATATDGELYVLESPRFEEEEDDRVVETETTSAPDTKSDKAEEEPDGADEDALDIAAVAADVVREALQELLGDVVHEARADSQGLTPTEVRWLLTADQDFAAQLAAARSGALTAVRDVISDLFQQDGMVEQ
jgi:hypothetical protein